MAAKQNGKVRAPLWLMGSLGAVLLLAACDRGPHSGHGFTLPTGDALRGQATFVALNCGDCHSVAGRKDLPQPNDAQMTVPLGGETTQIQTYGQLVTSVINPSHKISQRHLDTAVAEDGESKMRNYNEIMTVGQLIDLVTFLQDQYTLKLPAPTHYPYYGIP
mgnify:CR=1 FL=1